MTEEKCLVCGKDRNTGTKFCSYKCYWKYMKTNEFKKRVFTKERNKKIKKALTGRVITWKDKILVKLRDGRCKKTEEFKKNHKKIMKNFYKTEEGKKSIEKEKETKRLKYENGYVNPRRYPREERSCFICNNMFTTINNSTQRFCSKECAKIWQRTMWKCDKDSAKKRIKRIFKIVNTYPNSWEKKIIKLCKKYNLPFKYVGDFDLRIGSKFPDFICTNKKKLLIETYCFYFKEKNYEKERSYYFNKYGYKTLFLNDNDLYVDDWENICLNKIQEFIR